MLTLRHFGSSFLRGVVIWNSSSEEVDDDDDELLWMSVFCSAAVPDAIFSA